MSIRRATHHDIDAITSFTTGTFEWGDYVPDSIAGWIDDPNGVVLVDTDDADEPIAVGRCALLTPTEAWLHAARVRPDRRGEGIAGRLAIAFTDWAREHGALTARLLVEETNTASIRHIGKTGFRRTTLVHRGFREVDDANPAPQRNGGRRRPSSLKAQPGRKQDAPMIVGSWSTGEPGRALRGLVGVSWSFHTLRIADVESAAIDHQLWEVGGSHAITREVDGAFEVLLLDTTRDEAVDAIKALIDLADGRGATRFSAWVADCDWLVAALEATGCTTEPSGIYAHPL
jgi:GNAT superfamily N-acetyltransferase